MYMEYALGMGTQSGSILCADVTTLKGRGSMATKWKSYFVSLCGVFALLLSVGAKADDLQTVEHLDLARYVGLWHEIASFPQRYTRNCYNVTAEYALRDDGRISVVNSCHKGSATGRLSTIRGVARVVDESSNAKLKVRFFWPFEGDYWVIELGENYEYAVVSDPTRATLWILSRTPTINQATLDFLLDRLTNVHGFDVSKLKYTQQP